VTGLGVTGLDVTGLDVTVLVGAGAGLAVRKAALKVVAVAFGQGGSVVTMWGWRWKLGPGATGRPVPVCV
jgi:hypothetical protein